MSKSINFDKLEKTSKTSRWPSRDRKQSVQMSLRMEEEIYDEFRELASAERRTHGEMLEQMLQVYLELRAIGQNQRRSPEEMWEMMKERQPVTETS